jgi:DNA-binding NarL/FixJ family response regulator
MLSRLFGTRYNILTAQDEEQASAQLRETQGTDRAPDLIILDVGTPRLDGFQLVRRIMDEWDIPVIFLSCIDDPAAETAQIVTYAEDFVTKPFSLEELVSRIDRVLTQPEPANGLLAKKLTARQLEILTLLAHGYSDREIAQMIDVTARTVKWHLHRASDRLGAKSRAHAISIAMSQGLISYNPSAGGADLSSIFSE